MKWSLSEYNLICYRDTSPEIFRRSAGSADFDKTRLFEHTSDDLKIRYQDNLAKLADLPTLVVAEIDSSIQPPKPGFLSSISNVRKSGDEIRFRFNHLHKISFQEVFECEHFDIESYERYRTHWAIKEGNLIEGFFKLLQDSQRENRPKFFNVEQWPLPCLDHIAVMMPFAKEFNAVYRAIKRACEALGFTTCRVDEIYKPSKIIDDVFSTIAQSRLVICDLTDRNANVLYETGLAHALNYDVIMITQNMDDIPFDLRHIRALKYLSNKEGLSKLTEDLKRMISETLD